MIFHPDILALHISSILITFVVLYATSYGVQIIRRWNIESGSEEQLILERKTYLISTLLAYLFVFEILSLFLFIFTVDRLHTFFVGAMCAAGALYANGYGYPALILKVVNFLLAGLWLILNYADNRGYDYPLIKKKYSLLLLLAPLLLTEMIVQANYFLRLRPDIITSCCGSLFSSEGNVLISEISVLPSRPTEIAFYICIGLTILLGLYFYRNKQGGYLLSWFSGATLLISIASIVSFITVYFYELPTHHCPFCILQREYGYVGYPLYATLLGGTISGGGVGLLMPFRRIESLLEIIPSLQRRLALASAISFFIFATIVTYRMVFTEFVLEAF